MLLDLTKGITETPQYKAWKFPGGEIHAKLSMDFMQELGATRPKEVLDVNVRLNSSDDVIFLALILDVIAKDFDNEVHLYVPYMAYQQADRDFSQGETFSLQTITKMLAAMPFKAIAIFDPHSDVAPALLSRDKLIHVIDNSEYIQAVFLRLIDLKNPDAENLVWFPHEDVVILAPDAGAYKKIFKLCEKIDWTYGIECANKYRNTEDGSLQVRLSVDDFKGKDVLIIDDICVGGRTFIELAKQLITKNVGNLYLAVSHGIFSNGYDELEKYYQHIFTTNSIKDEYLSDAVEVIEII